MPANRCRPGTVDQKNAARWWRALAADVDLHRIQRDVVARVRGQVRLVQRQHPGLCRKLDRGAGAAIQHAARCRREAGMRCDKQQGQQQQRIARRRASLAIALQRQSVAQADEIPGRVFGAVVPLRRNSSAPASSSNESAPSAGSPGAVMAHTAHSAAATRQLCPPVERAGAWSAAARRPAAGGCQGRPTSACPCRRAGSAAPWTACRRPGTGC